MKIKRNSWHYKISNLLSDYEKDNDNLCIYFWRGVSKIAILFILGFLFGTFLFKLFTDIPFMIMTLFLLSSCMIPISAISYIRKKLRKSPEIPYENILVEYVKARKDKVCPLIEYVD